jgi:hypothetical protein
MRAAPWPSRKSAAIGAARVVTGLYMAERHSACNHLMGSDERAIMGVSHAVDFPKHAIGGKAAS